jgi:hypothetical protein
MTDVVSEHGLAIVEGHQPDIFYGSSLALQGVFTRAIQARFSGNNQVNLPWYWDPHDPTPKSTEQGTPDSPRKLRIGSEYVENPDARNYRPAIFVDAGEAAPLKDGVANRVGQDLPSGMEIFYARTRHRMEVLVVTENRGAGMVLADHVWFHLLACRMLIRRTFNIHEMTEPVKGPTRSVRRDKDVWQTAINFDVEVEMRWTTRPIAALLQEIKADLEFRGEGDALLGAARYALFGGETSGT